MTQTKIDKFSINSLAENENTEFYQELREFVIKVKNDEINNLLEKSKFVDYNKWSIIPIIFPLCVYYKRNSSIRWMECNVDFSRVSSKTVLAANMMKLDIPPKNIPRNWTTKKNILPYICDNLELVIKYVNTYKNAVEESMDDSCVLLENTTPAVLSHLYTKKYLDSYKTSELLYKFVGTGTETRSDETISDDNLDKLKYIIDKRNPSVDDFFEAFPDGTHYNICDTFSNHLSQEDSKSFLLRVIKTYGEEIYYPELETPRTLECVFLSAIKLGISGSKLCRKMLPIQKGYVSGYIGDFKKLAQNHKQ